MRRNSPAMLLVYCLMVLFLLQLAVNWPETRELFEDLVMAEPGQGATQTVWQSERQVVLGITECEQPEQFVAIVNGQARGTFRLGQCSLRVQDGDLIEIDGYADQTARVAVIERDRGVQLPVIGQEIYLANTRMVLARVMISR